MEHISEDRFQLRLPFYEQILRVPTYAIFHPELQVLEVYHLVDGKYQLDSPNEDRRFWIESLGLFLGIWIGKKAEYQGGWLRWWDSAGNLLFWGSELLEQERQLLEQERQRAEQAEEKSLRLAQKLREMGVDAESV
jgi:Putative restriction endonuclease